MARVTTMDATGALALKEAVEDLSRRGIAVLACGIRPAHRRTLASVGALEALRDREYATGPEALAAAHAHLGRTGPLPAGTA